MTAADALTEEPCKQRFSARGLLATKAQWLLPLGVSQAPRVRWAARGLMLLIGVSLLAYLLALWTDAFAGTISWVAPLLATCLASVWVHLARQMWAQLSLTGHLTLAWCGPLPAPSKTPDQASHAVVQAGWYLPDHDQAVSVQVVFELGMSVLLRVDVLSPCSGARTHWIWLAAPQMTGAQGHHLRALLFSVRATETGVMKDPREEFTAVMASFRSLQRLWLTLFAHSNSTAPKSRPGAIRRSVGARVAMEQEDFAPTMLLDPRGNPAHDADRFSDQRLRGGA
ncbi:MAG: hypothetical protein V4532_19305 [Pseudomonadota bacterium]